MHTKFISSSSVYELTYSGLPRLLEKVGYPKKCYPRKPILQNFVSTQHMTAKYYLWVVLVTHQLGEVHRILSAPPVFSLVSTCFVGFPHESFLP